MNHIRIGAMCALLCAWATAALGNTAWVVDASNGAGTDFTDVQSAIDAAADGDLILIKPGSYGNTVLDARSLTLIGEEDVTGDRPRVNSLRVQNSSGPVTVRGLSVLLDEFSGAALWALSVGANAEPVSFEDCSFETPLSTTLGAPGAAVNSSTSVTFTRCLMRGAPAAQGLGPFDGPFPASPGLTVFLNSSVHLYGCELIGGDGADATISIFSFDQPAVSAASALRVSEAFLFSAGSTLRGGDGGDGGVGIGGSCLDPTDGGDGVTGIEASLIRFDNTILPGAPGTATAGCPNNGSPGAALDLTGTTDTLLPETYRSFEATSPAFEGLPVMNHITGHPGENTIMLVSFGLLNTYLPAVRGVLFGDAPLLAIVLGPMPAAGELMFSVTVPANSLPAGIDSIDVYEQIYVGGATGTGLVSSPTTVTIVRAGL